jgi:hypothetical protein
MVVALVLIFFAVFPVLWIISASFSGTQSLSTQTLIPARPSLANYERLFGLDPTYRFGDLVFQRWIFNSYIPLGAPIWLETTAPWPEGEGPLRRLLIAQDSGGAIKGPVRGDVFWGTGPRALAIAGHMKSQGRYVVLLPKAAAPTS